MNWEPQPGTEAITGWINQGVLFALVLAVALVVGCAVLWAVGSMSAFTEPSHTNDTATNATSDKRRSAEIRVMLPSL